MQNKKPGRPRKPKGQKYKVIQVCLKPDQAKAIMDVKNKSALIREALDGYLKNER